MKRVGDKQAFKHRIAKEIVKKAGRIVVKLDGSDIGRIVVKLGGSDI